MPRSYKTGKKEVNAFLRNTLSPESRVLDVGPGEGTYHSLVGDHFKFMDACEVHAPYIQEYGLQSKYRKVYNQSVVEFHNFDDYDLVIMGDVLEHITVKDAQAVIERCKNVKQLLIAVPFENPQSGKHGVKHERHIQEDLTPENFEERYPGFEPIFMMKRKHKNTGKGEYAYGYYGRKGTVK